ncbi:MAG: GT4 family glycosyltransferase PelF [Candidatus Omnitrophica bacterium]|nr:GT4 family glycosyltransferase PelF [Candidatus Omnitrophota bacterium]
MKKIKIIHIITRLDRGGSSRIVLDITKSLNKDDFSQKIISGLTKDPEQDLNEFSKQSGVQIIFLDCLRRDINIFLDFFSLFKLYRLIKREKPDIIHTHTSKAGFLGRLAARMAKVEVIIYMPHGNIFYGYAGALLSRLFEILERFCANFTDIIVTLTDIGKKEFLSRGIGGQEKFVTIHNGIDFKEYEQINLRRVEQLKQEFKIAKDCAVVTTVSRLESVKGIEFFIKALKQLDKTGANFKALIVGEGSLKTKLVKFARVLDLEDKIIFLGFREDIKEIIALSDCVVNPALNEGFGLVILEAFALAKPVIATRVGGVREIVEDNNTGILVQPANPDELTEAIVEVLQNKEKTKALTSQAKTKLEKEFTKEKMLASFRDLYLNLAKGKK